MLLDKQSRLGRESFIHLHISATQTRMIPVEVSWFSFSMRYGAIHNNDLMIGREAIGFGRNEVYKALEVGQHLKIKNDWVE